MAIQMLDCFPPGLPAGRNDERSKGSPDRNPLYFFRQVLAKLCARALISAGEKVCGSEPAALRVRASKHACTDFGALGRHLVVQELSDGRGDHGFFFAGEVEAPAHRADTADGAGEQALERLLGDALVRFRQQVERVRL